MHSRGWPTSQISNTSSLSSVLNTTNVYYSCCCTYWLLYLRTYLLQYPQRLVISFPCPRPAAERRFVLFFARRRVIRSPECRKATVELPADAATSAEEQVTFRNTVPAPVGRRPRCACCDQRLTVEDLPHNISSLLFTPKTGSSRARSACGRRTFGPLIYTRTTRPKFEIQRRTLSLTRLYRMLFHRPFKRTCTAVADQLF